MFSVAFTGFYVALMGGFGFRAEAGVRLGREGRDKLPSRIGPLIETRELWRRGPRRSFFARADACH